MSCARSIVAVAASLVLLLGVASVSQAFSPIHHRTCRSFERSVSTSRSCKTQIQASSNDDNESRGDKYKDAWYSDIRFPASDKQSALDAVTDLCKSAQSRPLTLGESGLAFLFVSQRYADFFQDMVQKAHEILGNDYTTLLSVVGGGVIGNGQESDNPTTPAVSLLYGIVPPTAGVEVFMFGPDEAPPPVSSKSEACKAIARNQKIASYIMFVDPWAPIQQVLDGLDASGSDGAVVAGGISCPIFGNDGPTVALNGRAYPRGTAVGVGLSGTLGLQAVVAQGCRPICPAFGVTKAEGNLIIEIDSKPAMQELKKITEGEGISAADLQLVKNNGVLCGIAAPGTANIESGDYLVREILGFRFPSIMIGTEVKEGDVLRFHVRDSAAAKDDLQNMVGRAKTERMFAGQQKAGIPLAALQISCVARGRSLFRAPNIDTKGLGELINDAPVSGFFANGELGPVGIGGVGLDAKQTHMHGFTTVAAMICDFSVGSGESSQASATSALGEEGEDISAWG